MKMTLASLQEWNDEIVRWIHLLENAKGRPIFESGLARVGIIRAPASREQIAEAELRLGKKFPRSVVEFFHLSNGLNLPGGPSDMDVVGVDRLDLLRVVSPADAKILSSPVYLRQLFGPEIPVDWPDRVLALSVNDERLRFVLVSSPPPADWHAASIEWVGGLGVERYADLSELFGNHRRELIRSFESRLKYLRDRQ